MPLMVRVKPEQPIFWAICFACKKRLQSDRDPIWADLDGEPFVAYYCQPCADWSGAKPEERACDS